MQSTFRTTAISMVFLITILGCTKQQGANQLSQQEQAEGWTLLFDGKTLDNWHVYNKGKLASEWSAVHGTILCNPDSPDRHGDLITDKEYENYELVFDWKLSEKGNSGVFINIVEADSLATAWLTGPEYQLLDNDHKDYPDETKRSGCLFGLSSQKNEAKMESNQWNHSKIIQQNGKVKFFLNDILTTEMDFLSPEWSEMVSTSGFAKYRLFGRSTKGKIALQDWASGVSFRNIKIREL